MPRDTMLTIDTDCKREFLALCEQLSPEKLSNCGILSPTKVKERYSTLMARWHMLEAKIGHRVYEYDVIKWLEEVEKSAV
jgi:hypothetical protein